MFTARVWKNLSQAKLCKLVTVWPAQLKLKVKLYVCGGPKGPNIKIATDTETLAVCQYDSQIGKDYIQLPKRRLYQV